MRLQGTIALLACLLFSLNSPAMVRYALNDPALVATVDQWQLPTASFNLLVATVSQYAANKPSAEGILQTVVSNRVLAQHLKQGIATDTSSTDLALSQMVQPAQQTPLNALEKSAIRTIIQDKHIRMRYSVQSGLVSELHAAEPSLKAQSKKVSDADIEAYYIKHPELFSQVDEVKAQHIKLSSQQQADEVYAILQAGMDFSKAVEQWSIATDKHLAVPGDLGLIKNGDRSIRLVKKIALLQPLGAVSRPFRIPQDGWHIFYLSQRTEQILPLADKSVQHSIRRAVAREQIRISHASLLQNLLQQADININKKYINNLIIK